MDKSVCLPSLRYEALRLPYSSPGKSHGGEWQMPNPKVNLSFSSTPIPRPLNLFPLWGITSQVNYLYVSLFLSLCI